MQDNRTRPAPLHPHGSHTWRWALICLAGGAGALLAVYAFGSAAPATPTEVGVRTVPTSTRLANALQPSWLSPSEPPASIRGRVVDERREPVEGARVCAARTLDGLTDGAPSRCVDTVHDGSFALADLAPSSYVLQASAEGFEAGSAGAGRVFVLEPDRPIDNVTITLRRGGARVAGVVRDALGGPVPSADVELVRFVEGLRLRTAVRTDGEGRFEAWTHPARVTLRATADGYAPAVAHRVAPSEDVELVLAPGSRIRGRVVRVGSEEPVSGVRVSALQRNQASQIAPAVSDDDGRFSLSGLDPGTYLLRAEGEHARGGAAHPVAVGLIETVEDVRVEVVPAVRVVGHVFVESGAAPCQRGLVVLGPRTALSERLDDDAPEAPKGQGRVPSVMGYIEGDGTVTFDGLTPGRYHVTLQCLDYVLAEGPAYLDVRDEPLDVTWHMRPGLGLTVHVVDAHRRPVPRAKLTLLLPGEDGKPNAALPLVADAEGTAKMSANLWPGVYTIEPSQRHAGEPMSFELREGMGRVEKTYALTGSASLQVSVESEDGAPVDDVRVRADRWDGGQGEDTPSAFVATSLGGGRHVIGPLPPGGYEVEVFDGVNPPVAAVDSSGQRIHLREGDQRSLRVQLTRGARLDGRVLDELGGPVANAWVSATYEQDAEAREGSVRSRAATGGRVLTDMEGSFALDGLDPEARYTVRAELPHAGASGLPGVSPGREVELTLPRPGQLEGFVVDGEGRPVSECDVRAEHLDTGAKRLAKVRPDDGSFTLDRVPAGEVRLRATDLEGNNVRRVIEVEPGTTHSGLRLALSPVVRAAAEPSPTSNDVRGASAARRSE